LNLSFVFDRYEAGDHVAVYPSNDPEIVNRIGELLNIDLDAVFSLVNLEEDATKKNPFPCPTTFRTALTYYLDITYLPTTQLLKELAQYATDEEERNALKLMGMPSEEGKVTISDLSMNGIETSFNRFKLSRIYTIRS
jgi:NADPH-ferrihemoprotein reductase